jgi:glycosyltransferase involved in cell wall biosynthesis
VTRTSPLISIMVPTYCPEPSFLRAALLSALAADPGGELTEIEVVDDASPYGNLEQIVTEVGSSRVKLFRQARNLGLAANWNSCLERARGEWVHILHQDDWVYPGFYRALRSGLVHPGVGIAFCRHAFVDSAGKPIGVSDLERPSPGVVERFFGRIATGQRIQFSSALLKRSACLDIGGFNPSLSFALDWEMWVRLASRYAVWFEPALLACFRIHERSAGWNLAKAGKLVRDHARAIRLVSSYVPAEVRKETRRLAAQHAARYGFDVAARLTEHGSRWAGLRCGLGCLILSRTREDCVSFLRIARRAMSGS